MNERCDGKIDCPADSSDEDNCHLFVLNPGYKSTFPPTTNEENDKAQVKVSIHIKNVADVKELSMEFEVCVKIIMEWYDRRLTYNNLKQDQVFLNKLDENDITKIWLPLINYLNTDQFQTTRLERTGDQWTTTVMIVREQKNSHRCLFPLLSQTHNNVQEWSRGGGGKGHLQWFPK